MRVSHQRSRKGNDSRFTPPDFFAKLPEGTRFDLDVASPGASVVPWVPADRHLTEAEDGLTTPWVRPDGGRALGFMNPPYSTIWPWMELFSQHANGVALVFSRMDQPWYFTHVIEPGSLCHYMRRRITFLELYPDGSIGPVRTRTGEPGGSAGNGSVIVGRGRGREIVEAVTHPGVLVEYGRGYVRTVRET